MKKDFFSNAWVIRITSLLFAIVLFIYVQNETNLSLSYIQGTQSASIDSTEAITNVPVILGEHDEGVFVTGLPEKTEVRLTGPQNIISQITPENFQVKTEDFIGADLGAQTLRLVVHNLPEEVSYQVIPSQVIVRISPKETQTFPVEYDVSPSAVSKDVEIDSVTLNPTEVTLTGSAETMAKVDRVMVNITSNEERVESFEQTYRLQILDAEGHLLGLNANVIDIKAHVVIKPISKKVKVKPQPEGENTKKYVYQYEVLDQEVEVTGSKKSLDGFEELLATIDVSKIDRTKEVAVSLVLPEGIELAKPEKVRIKVHVHNKEESSNN